MHRFYWKVIAATFKGFWGVARSILFFVTLLIALWRYLFNPGIALPFSLDLVLLICVMIAILWSALRNSYLLYAAEKGRADDLQARVTSKLAERDLERPRLFVDGFSGHLQTTRTALPPGTVTIEGVHTSVGNVNYIDLPGYFNVIFTIKNWGRTPAIIYEQQFYSIFSHALPSEVHYKEPIARGEHIVGPGEVTTKFQIETYHFTADEKQNFINGTEKRVMFVFGFIRYKDVFGNKYTRGHAVRYLRRANSFVAEGGDAYNYEHKENAPSG